MKYFFKNLLVLFVPIKLMTSNLDNIIISDQIKRLLVKAYKIENT